MKISKYISILLTLIVLNSCSSFLEEELNTTIVFDEYMVNGIEAVSFLYSGLSSLQNVFFGQSYLSTFETPTDQTYFTDINAEHRNMSSFTYDNLSSSNATVWRYLYESIARMNLLIDRMETGPLQNTDYRERVVAQARFIRAFAYFNAVRLWGPVPVTRAYYDTSGDIKPERSPVEKVYELIIDDLRYGLDIDGRDENRTRLQDFAVATNGSKIMPDTVSFKYIADTTPSSHKFLPISKGAAQLLLAKVYLTRNAAGDYASAEGLVDEMIANPLYQLLPNYGDLFMADRKTTPNRCREVLFEIEADRAASVLNGTHRSVAPNSTTLPKPAMDINGNPTRFNTLILSGTASGHGHYVPTEFFLNTFDGMNDKRYFWMYQFTGSTSTNVKPTLAPNFRKGHDHTGTQQDGACNSLLLRFAEAYLIKAELRARAGDGSGVQDAMEPVLRRSQKNYIPYNFAGKSPDQMAMDVLDERAKEFAHEAGNRLFDMRRTGFKMHLDRLGAFMASLDELALSMGGTISLKFMNPKCEGEPYIIMIHNSAYDPISDPESETYNPDDPKFDPEYDPETPKEIPHPTQQQSIGGDSFYVPVPFLAAGGVNYHKTYSPKCELHPIPLREIEQKTNLVNNLNVPGWN